MQGKTPRGVQKPPGELGEAHHTVRHLHDAAARSVSLDEGLRRVPQSSLPPVPVPLQADRPQQDLLRGRHTPTLLHLLQVRKAEQTHPVGQGSGRVLRG